MLYGNVIPLKKISSNFKILFYCFQFPFHDFEYVKIDLKIIIDARTGLAIKLTENVTDILYRGWET